MNEKEERDLKVLAAPAEDKCASFARSPAARRRRPTARQTDGRADGCEPGPRAAERRARAPTGKRRAAAPESPRGPGARSTPGRTASPAHRPHQLPPGMQRAQD